MFSSLFANNISPQEKLIILVVSLWILLWKGLAFWHAARNNQRNWYLAILILNTLGVLEILYLFKFSKKPMKFSDLMFWK